MSDCLKRQTEFRKDVEQHRCINPDATTYRQLVVLTQCETCPVKVLRKAEGPPCKQKHQPVENPLPVLEQHEGFPLCPLRIKSPNGFTCSVTALPVTPEICYRCDEETRTHTAGWTDKAVNFIHAVRRWVAAGQPMRTAEEIKKLFDEHCSKCDRFDKDRHACKTCGCTVSEVTMEPLENKLRMGTEHCPLGRF